MSKLKQEAMNQKVQGKTTVQTKPRKRALKPEAKPATEPKVATKSKKGKASEPATPAKGSKKSTKAEPAKTKRKSHAIVSGEAVLAALSDGKSLGKAELVAACGGDSVAVTKTVLKLRGEGKVIATGGTRSTLYRAA
jgi:hypothetical protein